MLELLAAVVVLAIVASMALASYQGYRDRAAMLVDETNQKVLQAALKLYAYDTNALPGSLSQLRSGDIERAYALVTEGKERYTMWAALSEWLSGEIAEAQILPGRYYNNDQRVLTCPSDPTPPSRGGISYAIAPGWENRSLQDLLDSGNSDQELIIEADDPAGKEVVYRHGGGKTSVCVKVGGKAARKGRASGSGGPGRSGSGKNP